MAAWICPTCRIHYGETSAGICPADGSRLVLNLSGAHVLGNTLTHLLHVGPDGSTVWEATTEQGTRVALKLLRGPQDATAWSTAALLSHPRIVALRGYASIDDDLSCVVMQWHEGRTLAEALAEGPLPLHQALTLTDELLDALHYVHNRDIVHGDLHADTLFIEQDAHLKVMDVGVHTQPPLAEVIGRGERALDWYSVLYAPPERLATGRIDARSDLYSTAVLLWHMCTGAPPFGVDPQTVARHHLTARRPRLKEARPDVIWPADLQAVLDKAMHIRPEARYATAAEMRQALARVIAQVQPTVDVAIELPPAPDLAPPVALPPIGQVEEPAGGARLGWLVAGLAVTVGLGLMLILDNETDTSAPRANPVTAATGQTAAGSTAPSSVEVIRATPVTQAPPPMPDAAPPTAPPAPDAGPPDAASAAVASVAPPTEPPAAAPSQAPDSVAAAPGRVDRPRVERNRRIPLGGAQPTRGGSTEARAERKARRAKARRDRRERARKAKARREVARTPRTPRKPRRIKVLDGDPIPDAQPLRRVPKPPSTARKTKKRISVLGED